MKWWGKKSKRETSKKNHKLSACLGKQEEVRIRKKERKGKERKGRKGKERKGKEGKGKKEKRGGNTWFQKHKKERHHKICLFGETKGGVRLKKKEKGKERKGKE